MRNVNATPSLHEVDQLLGLRLMLEDALRRAQRVGPHQRVTATVLLDATVERATFLTCVFLGLQVKVSDPLDTLISRAKQHLGNRWQPRVLPDVRLLHRARNAAQHEGLAPDRTMLPSWASATEAYVVGLVDAVFAVDVRRVVMSDAIVDPQLRALVASAETALAAGELEASARASTAAFKAARDLWDRTHGAGPIESRPPSMAHGTPMHAQAQTDELRSVISTTALAADPVESAWFRAAAREPDVLDSDDVERMLSFAFGWVATFDLAQQLWVPDRRRRAEIAERRVRTGAEPARICEVISMDPLGEGRFRVIFRVRDVPGPDEYDDWADTLGMLLRAGDGPRGLWDVRPNGTVTATFPEGDATAAVERLAGALAGTDVARAAARDQRDAERAALEARTRKYRRELAAWPLPPWVTSVQILGTHSREPTNEGLLLVIDEAMANLVAPPDPDSGVPKQHRVRIQDLLRGHDFVDSVFMRARFDEIQIQIHPVPTTDQLVKMLGDADLAMQGWLAWHVEHDAARTAIVAATRAQITAAVRRASGDVA